MDNPIESMCYLINSDFVFEMFDCGDDEKGNGGFLKKMVIEKDGVIDDIRLVHEMSWPLWLGVCQTGTLVDNYLTGESTFIPHDEGEYELIEEDFEHLYQHLDCRISSRSDVQ